MTTKTIVFTTRKGGVGKTTLTYAVGEFLARELPEKYKVLCIDMDAQCSLSTSMIGDTNWLEADNKGQTIYQMFFDALKNTKVFDIKKAIITNASNLKTPNLHLLPSSIKLEDIKAQLTNIGKDDKFSAISPVGVLAKHLHKVKDDYDYILIDCPPDMGIPTLNALAVSDGFIIPTIPDHISTYGIPMVMTYIKEFSESLGKELKPYGLIFNKRRPCGLHSTVIEIQTKKSGNPPIFRTIVDERARLAESAAYDNAVTTIKNKYGGANETYDTLHKLAEEFVDKTKDEEVNNADKK